MSQHYYTSYPPQYAAPQYQQVPQYQQYQAQDPNQYAAGMCTSPEGLKSWFNVTDKHYLAGLAAGAAVALVLTNPTVQQALVKGAVKLWTSVQGSIEEIKEKVEDVKAEMSQKNG
ncbi:YtxH domain-containing protein [Megalodesulfovibrio paquesii]